MYRVVNNHGQSDTARIRSADALMLPAVREAIAALDTECTDAGAVRLAERYAAAIDEARDWVWAMRWLGPLLLDALEALGATPASRKALLKGEAPHGVTGSGAGGLARLRAARHG